MRLAIRDEGCGHGAMETREEGRTRGRHGMKAKLQRAAGKIEDGATVEIVAKAEANAEPAAEASSGSRSPEYWVKDEAGHEEAVDTRDFEMLR